MSMRRTFSLALAGTCLAGSSLVVQASPAGAAPPRPPRPTGFRLENETHSKTASDIKVIWRQRFPGKLLLLGAEIQESDDPKGPWKTAAKLVLTDRTNVWTTETLPPGTFKCYRVRSDDGRRKSSWTKPKCTITLVPLEPPDLPTTLEPPTDLKATWVSESSIRLSWKDNSDNESGFRPGGLTDNWAPGEFGWVVVPPNTTHHVFENIPRGRVYVVLSVDAYIGANPVQPDDVAGTRTICLERERADAIPCRQ